MKNIIKAKPNEYHFVTWIKKRIKNNLNFLAIAEGQTGAGKSWAMLTIAYDIDPDFETRQVAFSFREVMQIINSDWFKKKEWKIILFDEPQTDISNRTWQSLTNKLMNYLVSTFRHQNIVLLFASPYSDFLDSQTKKLLHCVFDVRGHSVKTKKAQVRPKLLQYNSKLKKFYEHSLYVIKGGGYQKLSMMFIDKPPKHIIDPYEIKKAEFTTTLNQDIQRQLDELALKNMPVVEDEEKPDKIHRLEGENEERCNYIKEHPNLLKKDYANAFGITSQEMTAWLKKIDNMEVNIAKYIGKYDYSSNLGINRGQQARA